MPARRRRRPTITTASRPADAGQARALPGDRGQRVARFISARIGQQVAQRALIQREFRIAPRIAVHLHRHAPILRERPVVAGDARRFLGRINHPHVDRRAGPLRARETQHVRDHPRQALIFVDTFLALCAPEPACILPRWPSVCDV